VHRYLVSWGAICAMQFSRFTLRVTFLGVSGGKERCRESVVGHCASH
jgi:hypothetical protein